MVILVAVVCAAVELYCIEIIYCIIFYIYIYFVHHGYIKSILETPSIKAQYNSTAPQSAASRIDNKVQSIPLYNI